MKTKSRRKKVLLVLFILAIVVLAAYTSGELYMGRDYQQHFVERKGRLVVVEENPLESEPGYSLLHVRLEDDKGLKVEGMAKFPLSGGGPYPVLVLLGGLRTGKKVLDYIEESGNVILVALDYPYEEKKSKYGVWEFVRKMPDMRKGILNTIPAVMLSIDYLCRKDEVDKDRIVLIGGSVGALFTPAAAACDQRVAAAAVLFGAGDLQALLYANIKEEVATPLAAVGSWVGALLVSPVEPLKYIDRISPRPVYLLNGTDDPRMPKRCTELLYEKAKQPKTVRWIPTGHLHIRSREFHDLVRDELVSWLVQNGMMPADSAAVSPSGRR